MTCQANRADAPYSRSESDTAPRCECYGSQHLRTTTNDAAAERHLRLAQKYYVARVTELRQLIAAEEAKFKCVVTASLFGLSD